MIGSIWEKRRAGTHPASNAVTNSSNLRNVLERIADHPINRIYKVHYRSSKGYSLSMELRL
jgi:hypothetical protein